MEAVKIPTPRKLEDTYTKTFRMQSAGADGKTIRISVPRDVVRKEARRMGLNIQEFLKSYRVEWRYDSFPGAYALFVPTNGGEQPEKD